MEPGCGGLARAHAIAPSPGGGRSRVCGSSARASVASRLQGNVAARSCLPRAPPAVGSHGCCVGSCVELGHGRSHVDSGWHERVEVQGLVMRRRTASPASVGCSGGSLFDHVDGHWFGDQPRGGSPQASSASTSGEFYRRGSTWGGKRRSRMRTCRCGSEELSGGGGDEVGGGERTRGGGGSPGSQSDQASARAGTLESELFLYTGRMRALENFRAEVAKPDEEIKLVRAAVFVAQHLYPRVTAEEVEAKMEEMAAELEPLLPPPAERYTMRMINTINKYLYGHLGYKGAVNYLDPDNSCINMVLKRREGLPLTMSLVYMELAKRVGLPMQGVNLPAHFMCRPTGDGLEFFIDAHANGKITFLQDAEERLSVVYGIPVEINPEFLKHTDITNRAFLLRLLFNLKRIYFERKDPVSTLCIIDYLKIVRPGVIEETRDYGICLYLLNRFSEAIPCLEAYIQESPRATDAESMRSLLTKMRRDKMSG